MRRFDHVFALSLLSLGAALPACSRHQQNENPAATESSRPSNDDRLEFDLARMQKVFPPPPAGFDAPRKYWAAFSHPNPYLSDYYGIHCLQRIGKGKVLKDLVPLHAAVEEETANHVRLRFHEGFRFDFHFGKKLVMGGNVMDDKFDYAWVVADDVDELIHGLQGFQSLLVRTGLANEYLVPNPLFALERKVEQRERSGIPPMRMESDPDLTKFAVAADAVLIVPDALHGDQRRYEQLVAVLESQQVEWFGIEMYGRQAQAALDTFVFGHEGSPEFAAARQRLIELAWKGKFSDEAGRRPEENRYFKLVEICRRKGIRVRAMESEDLVYVLWGHGETPFGGSVRNAIWVEALPTSGKGIVFGGSAHMRDAASHGRNTFVQDFLQAARPHSPLFEF